LENEWELVSEKILKEDGKIYEILAAVRGVPESPYSRNKEMELLFGPYLLKEKNQVFQEKWELEKVNWKRILTQLESAEQNEGTLSKKEEILTKIKMAEEALS
uniref:tRNA (adenine(22)-N(1))-methyltransferase TrmK n=1 Tax=Enterococcus faecium TaxID=1352 RepID=UPI0030C7B563